VAFCLTCGRSLVRVSGAGVIDPWWVDLAALPHRCPFSISPGAHSPVGPPYGTLSPCTVAVIRPKRHHRPRNRRMGRLTAPPAPVRLPTPKGDNPSGRLFLSVRMAALHLSGSGTRVLFRAVRPCHTSHP